MSRATVQEFHTVETTRVARSGRARILGPGGLLVAALLSGLAAAQEEPPSGTTSSAARSAGPETAGLPPEERILAESFPGLFEPMRSETPYFWSIDLNVDSKEDLIILARSKTKVSNAWTKLPIHNPPFEWASRGEIQENPMFEPQYTIREGESYLIVYHGGPRGWKELSLGAAFILQDVAEAPPEATTFGNEEEKIPALKIRYEGKPGLLYWAGDRYVVALKDE